MKRFAVVTLLGCTLAPPVGAQVPLIPADAGGANGLAAPGQALQEGLGAFNEGFGDNVGSNPMFQDGVGLLQGLSDTLRQQLIDPINAGSDGALLATLGDVGELLIDINTMGLPGLPGEGLPGEGDLPGTPDSDPLDGLEDAVGQLEDLQMMLADLLGEGDAGEVEGLTTMLGELVATPPSVPGDMGQSSDLAAGELPGLAGGLGAAASVLDDLQTPLANLLGGADGGQIRNPAAVLTGQAPSGS